MFSRFTNWYRQQTEDRRRLQYLSTDLSSDVSTDVSTDVTTDVLRDVSTEHGRTISEPKQSHAADSEGGHFTAGHNQIISGPDQITEGQDQMTEGQEHVTADSQEQEHYASSNSHSLLNANGEGDKAGSPFAVSTSVDIEAQSNEVTHAQFAVSQDQSNDHVNSRSGNTDMVSNSEDIVIDSEDDDVWTATAGIVATDTHGLQSNDLQTQSIDLHTQSTDDHAQSNELLVQSNDLLTQSNDAQSQSNALIPSLQSLAWRQWGKTIDWGRVRGQGSDIYSLAQGNPPPPISRTPSSLTSTPSRATSTPSSLTSTPSRVTSTPSRVTSTPSKITPTTIVRPSPRKEATVQGLVSQSVAVEHSESETYRHTQLNSTIAQSNSTNIQSNSVQSKDSTHAQSISTHILSNSTYAQSNSAHAQSNNTVVLSTVPTGPVSSPLDLALAPVRQEPPALVPVRQDPPALAPLTQGPTALVPVRQSPLLSAAASSTFGTPTLAQVTDPP